MLDNMTEGDEIKPVLNIAINKDGRIIKTMMKKNEETGNWEKGEIYIVDNIFSLINTTEKKNAFRCFYSMIKQNLLEMTELLNAPLYDD